MKITKLVIALTAASVMAMGLACVLISGIVIGVEASTAPQVAAARLVRNNARADANRIFDEALAIFDANNPTPAANVRENFIFNPETGLGIQTTRDNSIRNADRAFRTARTAAREDYRAQLSAAFTQPRIRVMPDGSQAIASLRLSPLGATMVVGLVVTFVGGALLVTMKVLNKDASASKQAKAA